MYSFIIKLLVVCLSFGVLSLGALYAGEHPGQEHGGTPAPVFTAGQIKKAIQEHINQETKKGGGVFIIKDSKQNNMELKLRFVKIHDPVRQIKDKGYFACSDFEVIGEKGKLYDLDFWLNPMEGNLVVTETKIHKNPKFINGQWSKMARYTFVNDNPVEVP